MLAPPSPLVPFAVPVLDSVPPPVSAAEIGLATRADLLAAVDPEDDEDLADDELPVAEPTEEESNFDDFDDEFDDDFEEEENDPDWDHGDEGEPEPPAKGPGGRK